MQAQLGIAEEYYEDNPNVIILTALADIGQPYSCDQWNNFSPNITTLIIDDDPGTIFNWFNSENGFPSTVFIDQDMMVRYKSNYINNYYMKGYIDDLLSDCGSDCISDPSAALFEYMIDGLTVTFIDLTQDINLAVITDWAWDFGDGSSSLEQYPTHTYNSPGTFYVTLDIVDQYGSDGLQYTFNNEYPEAAMTLQDGSALLITTDSGQPILMGDVNQDGELNILDVIKIVNHIINFELLTPSTQAIVKHVQERACLDLCIYHSERA